MSKASLPFRQTADGIAAHIRLTPKASKNAINGLDRLADGAVVLKVSVTAVPEKGKANKALLKLLSKTWGVGMRSLRLIKGTKDRNKTVLVDDADGQTFQILCDWAQTLE
ncbi:MAG: DUF167 domain-containing protein [Rhodospirillaceae bacterium]|nr:DUF167 domain-containing protein [Rhodospirillaceae bacterium]